MATNAINQGQPKILYDWVPRWLGILMLLFIFIPTMSINGTYSGNAAYIVGELGIMSEHIIFTSFATSIGMLVAGPFAMPILKAFGKRRIYILGFSIMLALNILCGYVESTMVLAICSFVLGFVRIVILLNTIFTLINIQKGMDPIPHLSPPPGMTYEQKEEKTKGRIKFQSFIFLVCLTISQIGSYHTSVIAYEYRWQYAHWFVAVYILIALVMVMTMIRPSHTRDKSKIEWPPVGQAILAAIFFFAVVYVLVYGKTYDWFDDYRIKLAAAIALISAGMFLVLLYHSKRRIIDVTVTKPRNVKTALLFFSLIMLLNASSMLSSAFMGMAMTMDSVKVASIGNWQLLGYVLGVVLNMLFVKMNVPVRWSLTFIFTLMTSSIVYLYFIYQTAATPEMMILPTVLRGMSILMLYAFCGSMGARDLDFGKQLGSWLFVMLIFRAVLAPVGGNVLYTNGIHHRSEQHIARYAQELDRANSEAANAFQRTQMGMVRQGKSYEEATQMATIASKGGIQRQAMLTTLKELTGWTIWFGIACIIIALLFPYAGKPKTVSPDLQSAAP